jgi:DNA-binding beta-propeller fold protein YncE
MARALRLAVCLPVIASLLSPSPAQAARGKILRVTHTSTWSTPSDDPRGLAYDQRSDRLLISDSEIDTMPGGWDGTNLFVSTRKGKLVAVRSLAQATAEPEDLAWDDRRRVLYVVDDNTDRVTSFHAGPDGRIGTSDDLTRTVLQTGLFGSWDPQGLDRRSSDGMLIVTDAKGGRVYKVRPGPDGRFDTADDLVRSFSTLALGFRYPTDVAFDTRTHDLFIVGPRENTILQTSMGGHLVRRIDLAGTGIVAASGIAFAPGTDGGRLRAYIADSGHDDTVRPNADDGQVVELRIVNS